MAAVQEAPVSATGKVDNSAATAPAVFNGKPKGNGSTGPAPLSPLAPGATQLQPNGQAPASKPVVIRVMEM